MGNVILCAYLIRRLSALAVGLVVAGLALAISEGTGGNDVTAALRDAGAWLAAPFEGLVDAGGARADVAANWAIAAAAYWLAGGALARFLVGAASRARTPAAPALR